MRFLRRLNFYVRVTHIIRAGAGIVFVLLYFIELWVGKGDGRRRRNMLTLLEYIIIIIIIIICTLYIGRMQYYILRTDDARKISKTNSRLFFYIYIYLFTPVYYI